MNSHPLPPIEVEKRESVATLISDIGREVRFLCRKEAEQVKLITIREAKKLGWRVLLKTGALILAAEAVILLQVALIYLLDTLQVATWLSFFLVSLITLTCAVLMNKKTRSLAGLVTT